MIKQREIRIYEIPDCRMATSAVGNIITLPAAKAVLGYGQMDYDYPVKRNDG